MYSSLLKSRAGTYVSDVHVKGFSLILFLLFSSYQVFFFLDIFQASSKFKSTKIPRNSTWYNIADIRTGTVFHINLQTQTILAIGITFSTVTTIGSPQFHQNSFIAKRLTNFQRLNKMTDLTSFFMQKCHPSPGDPLDRPWWRRTEPPFPHPPRRCRR